MRNGAFDREKYCLSACALNATELTEQRKIDVYQIGQKLNVIDEGAMMVAQKSLISALFPETDKNGKCVCIIAEDGVMVLRGDHRISSMIGNTDTRIRVKNSIKQLHEQLFEMLAPRYQFSKRTPSIGTIAAIVPEVIASTDRQSFAWLSCYWS
jgi:hypothetical protein